MTQKELFRTSILCKLFGALVLISIDPSKIGARMVCPECGNDEFIKDQWSVGWTNCSKCLSFAMLNNHLDEIEKQWTIPLS